MADEKEKPEVELSDAFLTKLAGMMNSAITDHNKRFEKKLEQRFAALESKSKSVSDDSEDLDDEVKTKTKAKKSADNADDNPFAAELKKMKQQMAQLQKEKKESEAAARHAKLTNELSAKLKGKVAEDWHDIAVEKLSGKVKFNADNQPEMEIDGLPASLEDGIASWLKEDGNKRFIPAPIPNRASPRYAPAPTAPADISKLKPGSDEHMQALGAEIHNAFNATGESLVDIMSK